MTRRRQPKAACGTPDLLIVADGKAYFLELKGAGGRVTDAQHQCREAFRAAGAMVERCVGIDAGHPAHRMGPAAMNTLDAALAYAGRNSFAVFPCLPRAKEPAIKRGFYAATTNPETIRRYWRVADRNIAIRTGMASRVWILDVDGEDGEASLRAFEAKHGALPPTWESLTARGRHIWFRCDCPVPCSTSKMAPGLDVRGDGGYVVAPPSIHPSGRVYVWSVDRADDLANAPDWLLRLARKKPAPTISDRAIANMQARRGASPSPYGEAALDYECVALAATAPGGRNHALNRAAFALFQLVAGGELAHEHVFDRLVDACHRNGLVKDDGLRSVVNTICSGCRAGLQYPRARSGAL